MVDVCQTIDKELAIPTASSKQSTRSGTSSSSSEELDERETVLSLTGSMMPWAGCVEPVEGLRIEKSDPAVKHRSRTSKIISAYH